MKFFKIENNPEKAIFFQDLGVNRIFLDLEIIGKKERQGHLNTVISETHSINDVLLLSKVLNSTELLVRVNPINKNSNFEIEKCINDGADILMLPMFTSKKEVQHFIDLVDGRVKTSLLLETSQALCRVDDILEVKGIDEIHIGLNDLHLSMNLDFMFELLSGGVIEYLTKKIELKNIDYGFGGIAPIDVGLISGKSILKEHIRLGSSAVILSRDFDKLFTKEKKMFAKAFVNLKNEYEKLTLKNSQIDFEENMINIKKNITKIISNV